MLQYIRLPNFITRRTRKKKLCPKIDFLKIENVPARYIIKKRVHIPLEISLMIPESQKHLVTLPLVTSSATLKMLKMKFFMIFGIFDPFPEAQK